ncbi:MULTISPECIES: M20 family metallopeptidase [unclassified Thermoactinomyces]|jgi:amidohydrolase|uniref:M20 metallopeptidase family protein n=1 Tax=unclassified Thermoactinomyces TaxID=2634588 RepID=UPI0018DB7548|nr:MULTISPECIES: M20 family metallopeptidase [unclassified Thermoactinomyces]MBH8596496.1 amidohydrolase [Thermoactinomyces sp. CICC 10523]MBH8608689.1 amidohydrolase [Thermoactinomyces sp. CICC 10521]
MAERAEAISDRITQWRRRIHANPELSFHEFETSRLVADILKEIPGMQVKTGEGLPTAVVGTLTTGQGPVIAIRADMDALPIREDTNHAFRSRNEGVMHACGHDAHTAILLGVAHLLSDSFQNEKIQGTVKFIFQPAEETTDDKGLTGARYMMKAGVLDGVDCAIALHMCPENPVGEVRVHDGYSMANVDVFEATIFGTGGHGAYPHLGTDPVWMLGPVLQALHGIVSRKVSPLEPAVISVGQIHAGSASNIIPSEVYIQGTMRSYDPAVRELLISELDKAFSVVTLLGGEYKLDVNRGEPALKNDPAVNRWIETTIRDLYPECRLIKTPFGLGGEDFSWMTQAIPGAMFFLGCALPDGVKKELHTPIFDIDERCLPIGAAILAETARRFLTGHYLLEK